jgi:hypothetical protein
MEVLGHKDEAERQHELAELGAGAGQPGPIKSLCEAKDLANLRRFYDASIAELEQRVSVTRADDPKLPYLRTLIVLTKQVELELKQRVDALGTLYQQLEQMHDFVHEIYPAD